MRRLPGPAVRRLSEGDQTPEALSELFRDWQRTQTQSSVWTPRSLGQQMDVWFCMGRNHQPRGNHCGWKRSDHTAQRALLSAPRNRVLFA
jgi:hypothetical protein